MFVNSPADFHVHLRQGDLCSLVTPHVRKGGFTLAYVMVSFFLLFSSTVVHFLQPNLKPPITTTEQALAYQAELKRIDPDVQYLMTLYLSPDLTPDEVRKAKMAGIVGQNRSSVQIVFSNRQSRRG
jgi:dihydroorotase